MSIRSKQEVRMFLSEVKPYKGIGMEGWIAAWYAKINRKDIAEFQKLADRMSWEIPEKSSILEVAPGPGHLSIELARRGSYDITGLDISKSFVQIAGENAQKASVNVDFQHGNASAMPFSDDTFDIVVCRAAFKNFSQPVEAVNEMFRVLKPGGRAMILDLVKDVSFEDLAAYIRKMGVGWLNSVLMKLVFRFLLVPRAYTTDQFRKMAANSMFGGCKIIRVPVGCEVVLEKSQRA